MVYKKKIQIKMKPMTKKLIAMNKLLVFTLMPFFACAGSKTAESTPPANVVLVETVEEEKVETVTQDEIKNQPIECVHPFGKDPEDSLMMRRNFSIYQEEMENKQYDKAYPLWLMIMEKTPCARKGPYIDAEVMFPNFLSNPAMKDRKEGLIDTFMSVFPQRIRFYGEEGAVKGRWAYYLNIYRPKDFKKVIELCERAIELEKNKLEYIVPSTYINAVLIAFKNKQATKEEIFNAYEKVSDIMEFNVQQGGIYGPYWKQVQDGIEESIKNYIKGEDVDEIFIPRLKANPDDIALKEKIVRLYRSSKSYSNPNYIMVLKSLFEQKPDASNAEELAKYYDNNNDAKNANIYYEKAAELTEDVKRKEFFYLKIAANHLKANNSSQAQSFANKVVALNPNNGQALIILAITKYNIAQSSCDDFNKKAAAWVTIDMLQRAINADPSVAADAQSKINNYKKLIPTKEEIFFRGLAAGQTYTVECIGASTQIRFFD